MLTKLKHPVTVIAGKSSNIQFMWNDIEPEKQFTYFNVENGRGECEYAEILERLLDHPKRKTPEAQGGFTVVGTEDELRGMIPAKKKQESEADLLRQKIELLEEQIKQMKAKGK